MADGFWRPNPPAEYDIFITAAQSDKPAHTRAYILLNLAGSKASERERSFVYVAEVREPSGDGQILIPAESKEDPECLKGKFWEICNPQTNGKTQVSTQNQKAGETI